MTSLLDWGQRIVYNLWADCQFYPAEWCVVIPDRIQMKPEDYAQGDAFQAEKRTVFSTEWLPVCAEAQLARPGDFLSATVGGWGVVAVRGQDGEVRVLRNACRHQNMPVVGVPAGNCESFR